MQLRSTPAWLVTATQHQVKHLMTSLRTVRVKLRRHSNQQITCLRREILAKKKRVKKTVEDIISEAVDPTISENLTAFWDEQEKQLTNK